MPYGALKHSYTLSVRRFSVVAETPMPYGALKHRIADMHLCIFDSGGNANALRGTET